MCIIVRRPRTGRPFLVARGHRGRLLVYSCGACKPLRCAELHTLSAIQRKLSGDFVTSVGHGLLVSANFLLLSLIELLLMAES